MPVLLETTAIAKSFAGVQALRGVSFDVRAGEVHALVGENGAGKSTLIKIMTGAEAADSGTIAIGGHPVAHMAPHTSRLLGIAAIYQQPALFPDLSIAENIGLAVESGHVWRRVDWTARRRHAALVLERVGADLDPNRLVGTLTMPEQQIVEIAKALGTEAKVLIMDEPTASQGEREVQRLLDLVARLRAQGTGIIYISHRLEEVLAIADRITVLRDGESVATRPTGDMTRDELIRLMVGRGIDSAAASAPHGSGDDVALELRGVSHRATGVHDVSLALRRGEILGLAGLVGSGRTQLAEVVFGLTPADSGEILIDGRAVRIASVAQAIALGIGYLPEDRRRHGVIPEMSVAHNTTLATLSRVSRHGLISRSAEFDLARTYIEQFRIKTPSPSTPTESLSGGNQQKVALARWLSVGPSVLILDEPTQGVNVGAKAEIHALVRELARGGLAILMISSELEEVLGLANRTAVMRKGTVAAGPRPRGCDVQRGARARLWIGVGRGALTTGRSALARRGKFEVPERGPATSYRDSRGREAPRPEGEVRSSKFEVPGWGPASGI